MGGIPWKYDDVETLKRLAVEEHLGPKIIAETLGRSPGSVSSKMIELGITGNSKKTARPWRDREDRVITEMRERGASYVEIAAELGRHAASVHKRAKVLGIDGPAPIKVKQSVKAPITPNALPWATRERLMAGR